MLWCFQSRPKLHTTMLSPSSHNSVKITKSQSALRIPISQTLPNSYRAGCWTLNVCNLDLIIEIDNHQSLNNVWNQNPITSLKEKWDFRDKGEGGNQLLTESNLTPNNTPWESFFDYHLLRAKFQLHTTIDYYFMDLGSN